MSLTSTIRPISIASKPRPVLAVDPFVSNLPAPLQFYSNLPTPSSNFVFGHWFAAGKGSHYGDEDRSPRDLQSSSPPGIVARGPAKRPAPMTREAPSHPPTYIKGPLARSQPPTPSRTQFDPPNTGSLDVEMLDAFVTPPMTRVFPSTSSLRHTPARAAASHLAPINTHNLPFPQAPLTPPLTPPFISASQPLAPPYSSPIAPSLPPTLSARILQNHILHLLFSERYTIHEELGCGGFGFVVRAVDNCDGRSVAVKFIERRKIPPHGWVITRTFGPASGVVPSPEGKRLIPMEAYILGNVSQIPGVVRYIDLFEDQQYFYLVMEHHGTPWQSDRGPAAAAVPFVVPQTATPTASPILSPALTPMALSPPRPVLMMRHSSCDLFECIEQHSRFSEDTARHVFAQVVEVVYQLGKLGICHRDIKDENIVVSADFQVKLIDFGSAVLFNPKEQAPLYSRFYGTTSFASAEILRGEQYQAPPSEVWSLGVLLSILITGEVPFADQEAAKIGQLSVPRVALSDEVNDLMHRCLTLDPADRIAVGDIRRHSWLSTSFLRS